MAKNRIFTAMGISVCCFAICFLVFSMAQNNSIIDEKISYSDDAKSFAQKATPSLDEETISKAKPSWNVLVCGVDQSSKLTDVILLASYHQDQQALSLLQIPRDTFIGNTYPTGKINSVYASHKDSQQGMKRLKDTVEEMFQLPIQNTVVVNLSFFNKAVDAIGGVPFDVPKYIDYLPGKALYPGEQVLTGAQAEWLIRYRKGYATGDIGRLDMQKQFLSALGKRMKTLDLPTLITLSTQLYGDVKTDVPLTKVMEMLPSMTSVDLSKVSVFTLDGYGKMYGTSAVYEIDKEKATKLLNDHFRDAEEIVEAEQLPIAVVPFQPTKEYNEKSTKSEAIENRTNEQGKNEVSLSPDNPWADFLMEEID